MFNFVKSLMFNPAPVHYLVDSDFRTVAQGWARADQTGPLDLWAVRNPGYVYRTGDYTDDSVALQAANDSLVDFRGDMIFFTPGAYSLPTAIAVDVAAARWFGTPYKSPKWGAPSAVRNTTITATVADVFADGAAESMANMEVAYLNFVPLTAEDLWNLSVVQTGLYFHDFIFDTVSVATSGATQFMVSLVSRLSRCTTTSPGTPSLRRARCSRWLPRRTSSSATSPTRTTTRVAPTLSPS